MRYALPTGSSGFLQFLKNYAYYRKLGWSPRRAWRLAGQTIAS